MFLIDGVMVSRDVFTAFFRCDLARCGGICCVQGDGHVPLTEGEARALAARQDLVAGALDSDGARLVGRLGAWVRVPGYGLSAPLRPAGGCVYARRAGQGRPWQCVLENLVPLEKPLSCQLYPIRIRRRGACDLLLYHRWDICVGAEMFGRQTGTRLFRFVEAGLVSRYGAGFYRRLKERSRLILGEN